MVTGSLLHHHLHPRSPLHLAESHYVLCRRSALNRLRLPPKRYTSTPPKPGFLQPTLKSVHCLHQEEQAGNDGEAVEWVNKAAHDPMVEFDPVTVFRRIVAERRISSAMAKAKEEEANLALQTTSPPPFFPGSKWRGKSGIAIFTALLILVVVAALYFLRSKKGSREDVKELTSADGKDTLEASVNGRRKIVEDVIKAPDSVLTAMALGAASVSRPKVHSSSPHDTLHAPNGNVVESQTPEGVMDVYPVVSMVAVEDMKSDLHGKAMFGQTPSSASSVEDFTPFKIENVGIEVTEGPWFGQGVNDTASEELQDLESVMLPLLVGSQELETEKLDGLLESQALPSVSETIVLPAAQQFDSEISIGEAGLETSGLTNIVDGDFHGEVVAVSEQPNHSNIQVLDFKPEESPKDGVFAESSTTGEKVEETIEEDSITRLKGGSVAEDTFYPEPNIVIESPALDLSNGQFDETDSGSDDDDNENTEHHGVEQSLTLNQDDGVMSLEASDSKNAFEDVQEGYTLSPSLDSINTEGQENVTSLLSNADHMLEAIETVPDDALDGVSSSANMSPMDQVEEEEGFVHDPIKEPLSDYHAAVEASEEDSREDSKKALDAAVPAIAIGFGTAGALFGVAGGLQVVGFAALASILSHDLLWAQSRESLWQELNGITDRQKLLEFLAKRNIMNREQEKPNL